MRARICPGPSPPPSCQSRRSRSASCTSGVVGPAKPGGARPHARIGGQPVDVVAGEAGVVDGGQAGLDGEVEVAPTERAGRSPTGRCPEMTARALERDLGRLTPPTRRGRAEQREVDVLVLLEDDLDRPSRSRRPRARRPTRLVMRRTLSLLVDGDQPDEVGLAAGDPLLHVAGAGHQGGPAADRLGGDVGRRGRTGQRGAGGWTNELQSWQRRNRSRPSAPLVQKKRLSGRGGGGAGSTGPRAGQVRLRRRWSPAGQHVGIDARGAAGRRRAGGTGPRRWSRVWLDSVS